MASANQPPATSIVVTHTSTNNNSLYTNFHAKNFLTDPVFSYLTSQAHWYHHDAAVYHLLRLQFHAAAKGNRALYYSASSTSTTAPSAPISPDKDSNLQCHAIILTPGKTDLLDLNPVAWSSIVFRGLHKLFWYAGTKPWVTYFTQIAAPVERLKAATFAPGETYYYISYISTDAQHRGKGLARALIKDFQAKAGAEGKPVWLEASSSGSRKVYMRCGFVDVRLDGVTTEDGGLRIGAGETDEHGVLCKGERAVGVMTWPMVWWPEGHKKKTTVS